MIIIIPTAFRSHTEGKGSVQADGETVAGALLSLTERYPDLKPRLFGEDGRLVSYVGVFVNDRNIRDLAGDDTEVSEGDEILLVPAIAGG